MATSNIHYRTVIVDQPGRITENEPGLPFKLDISEIKRYPTFAVLKLEDGRLFMKRDIGGLFIRIGNDGIIYARPWDVHVEAGDLVRKTFITFDSLPFAKLSMVTEDMESIQEGDWDE